MKALVLTVLVAAVSIGCGKEIGDSCVVSSDCDPNGQRTCDVSQKEGYCTILGCDVSTCPDEAVCVRFFSGSFANKSCDDGCSLDELCDLNNRCVPRSAEARYCMRTCDTNDDCRDGYECRDLAKMKEHGGEPVLEAGTPIDSNAPKFCAIAP